MIFAYVHGNKVVEVDGKWQYEDGTLVDYTDLQKRPCPRCGCLATKDGHDQCIKNLPGVKAACCGHGIEMGYVLFENGLLIRGYWD
jgi:hypothetical protein